MSEPMSMTEESELETGGAAPGEPSGDTPPENESEATEPPEAEPASDALASAPELAEREEQSIEIAELDDAAIAMAAKLRPGQWAPAEIESAIEALLFACPDALTARTIRRILPDESVDAAAIDAALDALAARYERPGSGIVLVQISGGWQIQTREPLFRWVKDLVKTRTEEKITAAALETLAIIAYKQPITRAEVDDIRGVGSGQIIRTLMDKKLVKVVGRVELPGRPFQYGTTPAFLDHFGLRGLQDLPGERDL